MGHVTNGGPVTGTRFAAIGRAEAIGVLAAFAVSVGACVAAATGPSGGGQPGPSDWVLYRAVVARVHAGEGYYRALGDELRGRGYPTRSVLNWRTPLLLWLIARLPGPAWGRALAASLALVTIAAAFRAVEGDGGLAMAACHAPLLFLALAGCFLGDAYLMGEVWSGALIVLWAAGTGRVATAAAVLAPFFRELALPVPVIAAILASRRGRRGEATAQLAGLVLFAAYYGVHAVHVAAHRPPPVTGPSDWVRLGGLRFVVATSAMNGLLILLPRWVAAVALPASVVGLAGWRSEAAKRALCAVLTYLALFAVVGRPDNVYWGFLYAPLLTFGVVWAPVALRDLFRRLRPRDGG